MHAQSPPQLAFDATNIYEYCMKIACVYRYLTEVKQLRLELQMMSLKPESNDTPAFFAK